MILDHVTQGHSNLKGFGIGQYLQWPFITFSLHSRLLSLGGLNHYYIPEALCGCKTQISGSTRGSNSVGLKCGKNLHCLQVLWSCWCVWSGTTLNITACYSVWFSLSWTLINDHQASIAKSGWILLRVLFTSST